MSEELKSTDGKVWSFFGRFDIPDLNNQGEIYLTRWRLLQTPWFSIFLHRINLPDSDRYPHDHPWDFWSLILQGGYVEHVVTGGVTRRFHWRRWSWHKMPTDWFHKIQLLDRRPTWSLVLTGRRKRVWGFLTLDGWVPFHELLREDGAT